MLRHRPNCATDHQDERQLDEKKFRHNVAERLIPWGADASCGEGSEGDETQKAQAKANSRATTYRRHFLSQSFGYIAYQAGSSPRVLHRQRASDNFRSAYNLLLKSFVEEWRWKKLRPHPYARQYRFFLPPDYFPIYITYEAKDGRRRGELIVPRWTEEGWRVSLGRFIYFLYLQPDEIPKATKREVLLRLLKSGFYAFPTEHGEIFNIPTALDWLEAEMAKERR
jgi:hypothetical protein